VCETAASALVPTIRRVLELYLAQRTGAQETFGAFVHRVGPAHIAECLGAPVLSMEPINEANQRLRTTFDRAVAEAE